MRPIRRMLLVIVPAALVLWIAWGNTALMCSRYAVSGSRLPEAFQGFRIAQISDLHNGDFGDALIALLEKQQPDIIVITGDLIDSRRTDVERALEVIRRAAGIAPCYYVTGNHESRLIDSAYPLLEQGLKEVGVTVLHGESVELTRNGQSLTLVGMDDPGFSGEGVTAEGLEKLAGEGFAILLSHRPEYFEVYVQAGFDLVLCGHTHGGQVRLPFLGGIIAPNQGFFPAYDAGLYREADTAMVISRGIGNSLFPLRVNNRPELVMVELHRTQ